jgi:hypothetical protein
MWPGRAERSHESLEHLTGTDMLTLHKPVYRATRGSLGYHHGTDRGRQPVVALVDGDLVSLRPKGTRRPAKMVSLFDIYDMAIRLEAQRAALEKARAVKERKAIRLAADRQRRAEKRLFKH